jgi:hypothetical protein
VYGNQVGATNVVYCNVTALDAIYTYSQSQYVIHESSPSSLENAQHMMAFGASATWVKTIVEGTGPQTIMSYEQSFALMLARQVMASGAHLYRPKDALEVRSERPVSGSMMNLVPLTILGVLMLAYWYIPFFVWQDHCSLK